MPRSLDCPPCYSAVRVGHMASFLDNPNTVGTASSCDFSLVLRPDLLPIHDCDVLARLPGAWAGKPGCYCVQVGGSPHIAFCVGADGVQPFELMVGEFP